MKSLIVLAFGLSLATPAAAFEFKDGDRVVLIGSTVIEREQRYGYWETALVARNPDKNITVRNLGWSGDTVWGEARAEFGTAADGYKHLVDHVRAEKPTVILVAYGTNESFAGPEGLPKFKEQYKKLLDDLATTKSRFILMAPPMFEKATWVGGHYDERKKNLELYTQAIKEIADARKASFVNDVAGRYGPAVPLMDNGIHFTAFGYCETAGNLQTELRPPIYRGLRRIDLPANFKVAVREDGLPAPPLPGGNRDGFSRNDCVIFGYGLKEGRYTLEIDGQPVQTEDAETWMRPKMFDGVLVRRGPSLDQAERLRQTIVAKNELYFHRWRPQNTTYLFGFRKHEQGQNAREIPQFDPLVAAKEKEIADTKQPREHVYELVPAKEKK